MAINTWLRDRGSFESFAAFGILQSSWVSLVSQFLWQVNSSFPHVLAFRGIYMWCPSPLLNILWGIVSYTWWYQLGMSKYMIRNDEEGRWLPPSPIRGEGRRRC